jgi:hypothetical protein
MEDTKTLEKVIVILGLGCSYFLCVCGALMCGHVCTFSVA